MTHCKSRYECVFVYEFEYLPTYLPTYLRMCLSLSQSKPIVQDQRNSLPFDSHTESKSQKKSFDLCTVCSCQSKIWKMELCLWARERGNVSEWDRYRQWESVCVRERYCQALDYHRLPRSQFSMSESVRSSWEKKIFGRNQSNTFFI